MTRITVTFDPEEGIEEGRFLLELEKVLRACYPALDIRVYKARKHDDSPLRLQRTT